MDPMYTSVEMMKMMLSLNPVKEERFEEETGDNDCVRDERESKQKKKGIQTEEKNQTRQFHIIQEEGAMQQQQ